MIQKLQKVIRVLLLIPVLAINFSAPSYATGIPQTDWILKSLNGQPPLEPSSEDTEITIVFNKDNGQVYGSGGCNRFFGSYNLTEDSQIRIGRLASTRRYCYRDINAQEKKFFQALESVDKYSVSDSTLSLTNSKGEELVFRSR